jgi:hypothetical protein
VAVQTRAQSIVHQSGHRFGVRECDKQKVRALTEGSNQVKRALVNVVVANAISIPVTTAVFEERGAAIQATIPSLAPKK